MNITKNFLYFLYLNLSYSTEGRGNTATKVILAEIRKYIPRYLLCNWTIKQEGREKTSQDIACRCRSVPLIISEPRENRETFGMRNIQKKPFRQEQGEIATHWQELRPLMWLVDQTEGKTSADSVQWTGKEDLSITSESPPKNLRHQKSKGESSITEWSLEPFSKRERCWNKLCKTKQPRCQSW